MRSIITIKWHFIQLQVRQDKYCPICWRVNSSLWPTSIHKAAVAACGNPEVAPTWPVMDWPKVQEKTLHHIRRYLSCRTCSWIKCHLIVIMDRITQQDMHSMNGAVGPYLKSCRLDVFKFCAISFKCYATCACNTLQSWRVQSVCRIYALQCTLNNIH